MGGAGGDGGESDNGAGGVPTERGYRRFLRDRLSSTEWGVGGGLEQLLLGVGDVVALDRVRSGQDDAGLCDMAPDAFQDIVSFPLNNADLRASLNRGMPTPPLSLPAPPSQSQAQSKSQSQSQKQEQQQAQQQQQQHIADPSENALRRNTRASQLYSRFQALAMEAMAATRGSAGRRRRRKGASNGGDQAACDMRALVATVPLNVAENDPSLNTLLSGRGRAFPMFLRSHKQESALFPHLSGLGGGSGSGSGDSGGREVDGGGGRSGGSTTKDVCWEDIVKFEQYTEFCARLKRAQQDMTKINTVVIGERVRHASRTIDGRVVQLVVAITAEVGKDRLRFDACDEARGRHWRAYLPRKDVAACIPLGGGGESGGVGGLGLGLGSHHTSGAARGALDVAPGDVAISCTAASLVTLQVSDIEALCQCLYLSPARYRQAQRDAVQQQGECGGAQKGGAVLLLPREEGYRRGKAGTKKDTMAVGGASGSENSNDRGREGGGAGGGGRGAAGNGQVLECLLEALQLGAELMERDAVDEFESTPGATTRGEEGAVAKAAVAEAAEAAKAANMAMMKKKARGLAACWGELLESGTRAVRMLGVEYRALREEFVLLIKRAKVMEGRGKTGDAVRLLRIAYERVVLSLYGESVPPLPHPLSVLLHPSSATAAVGGAGGNHHKPSSARDDGLTMGDGNDDDVDDGFNQAPDDTMPWLADNDSDGDGVDAIVNGGSGGGSHAPPVLLKRATSAKERIKLSRKLSHKLVQQHLKEREAQSSGTDHAGVALRKAEEEAAVKRTEWDAEQAARTAKWQRKEEEQNKQSGLEKEAAARALRRRVADDRTRLVTLAAAEEHAKVTKRRAVRQEALKSQRAEWEKDRARRSDKLEAAHEDKAYAAAMNLMSGHGGGGGSGGGGGGSVGGRSRRPKTTRSARAGKRPNSASRTVRSRNVDENVDPQLSRQRVWGIGGAGSPSRGRVRAARPKSARARQSSAKGAGGGSGGGSNTGINPAMQYESALPSAMADLLGMDAEGGGHVTFQPPVAEEEKVVRKGRRRGKGSKTRYGAKNT